jgi:hypothetical protein
MVRRRLLVCAASAAVLSIAWAGQAQAAIVGSKPAPSYQANGRVAVVVISGTTAYLGGKFTSMRPAGNPAGTGEVTRNHAAAINLTTGALLPWNPNLNGLVEAIKVDPINHIVYLGGGFGTVNGSVSRKKIAAVNDSTGAVIKGFKTTVNGEVRGIELSNGQLYLGGAFTLPRPNAASVNPATGAFNSAWAPTTDGPVDAITTTQDGSNKIVIGGAFNTLNGVPQNAIGAVDPTSGATLPWAWQGPHRGTFRPFDVVSFYTDSSGVYAAGTGNGGTVVKSDSSGNIIWQAGGNGNTVGVAVVDGIAYIAGHFTVYCGATMGVNGCTGSARQHLMAVDATSGVLQTWHPSANSSLGTFTIAGGAGVVATGGDFTKLGGVSQQGFGEFKE